MNKDNSPLSTLNWLRRAKGSQLEDDDIIYVPMEVIRNIDRAIDSIEKARQGLMKAAEERKTSENSEPNDNEPKNE